MKLVTTLIFFILYQITFGQNKREKLDAWDSLRIRTSAEVKRYENILQRNVHYSDTAQVNNEIIISHYSSADKRLQTISNNLDNNNCVRGVTNEYYNQAGLIAFRQGFKKCCSSDTVGGYKCFERVTDYERFEYDSNNRILVHVFHVTTPMTYKETYSYSKEGNSQIKREKIDETKFWE